MGKTGEQNLSAKLINIHIVNLNDAIQNLTKRLNLLETFILKQFGSNVLNCDAVHGNSVAGPTNPMHLPSDLKNQIDRHVGTSSGFKNAKTSNDLYQSSSAAAASDRISQSQMHDYHTKANELTAYTTTTTTNKTGFKRKRQPYLDMVKKTELKTKQIQMQAKEFEKYSFVEVASPLESESHESEEALPMKDSDNDCTFSKGTGNGAGIIRSNESFACQACQLSFVNSAYLQDHLETTHPSMNTPLLKDDEQSSQMNPKNVVHESSSSVQWEFILSNRGGLNLCINNFLFQKKRTQIGKDYYYCRAPDCLSSVQMCNDELILSTLKENHEHPNHKPEILNLKIIQNIRKRALDEPQTSVLTLYRQERKRVEDTFGSEIAEQVVPRFESLRVTLYRDRDKDLGKERRRPKKGYPPGCNLKSDSKKIKIFPPLP